MMLLSGAGNNLNSPIRLATGKKIPHHFNNNREIYNIIMLVLPCNKFNTLSLVLKDCLARLDVHESGIIG
jgi:hypothetical protein